MSNNILALDLSTTRTGYAISIDEQLKDYGCIVAGSRDKINRIYHMRDEVLNLIKKYNINEIVIEEVPPMPNLHTYKILMWLQAAIVFAIYNYDKNIPITYILPSEWRAAIKVKQGKGIKREELKKADIEYINNFYNIQLDDDDICDAICLLKVYESGTCRELNW